MKWHDVMKFFHTHETQKTLELCEGIEHLGLIIVIHVDLIKLFIEELSLLLIRMDLDWKAFIYA